MGVKVLTPIEGIRTRPGMYIGSNENPNHLVNEVLDNAIDEIRNGFATKVSIYLDVEQNTIWIADNGRGIPIQQVYIEDLDEYEDSIKAICTRPHSGEKFDTETYNNLMGQNGIGLVITNALSDWMVVRTNGQKNDGYIYVYNFVDGELKDIQKEEDTKEYSTVVGFKPSDRFFDSSSLLYSENLIKSRILLAQCLFPNCVFEYNGKELPKISLEQYANAILGISENSSKLRKLEWRDRNNQNSIITYITYTNSLDTIVYGDVNVKQCEGTYLSSFQTILKNNIQKIVDKKYKNVKDSYYLLGLRLYVSLKLPEPVYDSQTKTRMVARVLESHIKPLESQIIKFLKDPEIKDIIEYNLDRKVTNRIVKKKHKTKKISNTNKLADCTKIPGETLYICEGDSAAGTLIQIRDKKTEAVFPLRGKALNVEKANIERIKKNKEITDLIEALGPEGNRRYKYVKILADADSDGLHICALIILFLQKFASDLIKEGRVFVIIPPKYGATKGNKYTPLYSLDDKKLAESKGFHVTLFKGLGEMNPDELETCIRGDMCYQLEWPEDKDIHVLKRLVNDTNIKKSLLNKTELNMDVLINVVNQKIKNN